MIKCTHKISSFTYDDYYLRRGGRYYLYIEGVDEGEKKTTN